MIGFEHLRRALNLERFDRAAAQTRMAPEPRGWRKRDAPPRAAAVMILVYADADGRLNLVLTLRNRDLRGHSGQVSFPGGGRDPGDSDLTATAQRETCEEIGVCGARVAVIGAMPRFYIPASHFDVRPVVARYDGIPAFQPNPAEVAEVFSFALEDLLRSRFKRVERRVIRGVDVRVPYYAVRCHKVWGATAIMLSELEGRLRRVLPREVLLELA